MAMALGADGLLLGTILGCAVLASGLPALGYRGEIPRSLITLDGILRGLPTLCSYNGHLSSWP